MSRYSWGADEFLFVELAEEMSLRANFRAMAIATKLRERRPDGLLDICPANASYQVRFDPDRLAPADVERLLRDVDEEVGDAHGFTLDTRIVEVPVLYDDPWTNETQSRFRDRHQDPSSTDLEYAARINGFSGKQEFIDAHAGAPWFASMVGFVAGLPFLYQMVPRDRQLEVPKYVRPRTDTPALTIGHGGCFGCIYSVRGAGGYQMFGITPVPIYEPSRGEVFFGAGDIVKFTPIDRERYDALSSDSPSLRFADVSFDLDEFEADPDGYNGRLLEVLG
jgi:KipI family sensor histidine kinase inhibitor